MSTEINLGNGFGPCFFHISHIISLHTSMLSCPGNFLEQRYTPMGLTAKFLCQFLCVFVFCIS